MLRKEDKDEKWYRTMDGISNEEIKRKKLSENCNKKP